MSGTLRKRVKDAARKKFKRGDRVVTTAEYAKHFKWDSQRNRGPFYGVVAGFSKDGALVRVRKDGNESGGNYHPDFWEVAIEWEENFSSVSQKTTATGTPSPPVVKAGNIRIESIAGFAADTVQAEQLVNLVTPEVRLSTSVQRSVAWSKAKSLLRGIKLKLRGVLEKVRI